jgi:hypothetical protein
MIGGECSLAYKSKETPMVTYVNIHHNLEIMRQLSLDSGAPGPRVKEIFSLFFVVVK